MSGNTQKLGLVALIGLVVGSSIGGGIFNAAKDIAGESAPGPAILAWIIVSVGMLCLVLCLNNIIQKRPDLGGIVEYAEAGFGKFWGLMSGWGYWLSTWLGNIAFAALLLDAIGNFIPILGLTSNATGPMGMDTSNILPFIFISAVMWGLVILVNRGVESAAIINVVVLVAKLIPLIVTLFAGLFAFKVGMFTADFWGNVATNAGGIIEGATTLDQLKGCFMVMLWVFVGMEGASIFCERAEKKSDAAKATIMGFLFLVAIYVLLSLIPFGILSQEELADLPKPALAGVLREIVGPWGFTLVNFGLIVSLLGAWLAWTLLPIQTMQQMSIRKYIPTKLGQLNKNGTPSSALFLTSICVQVFMISYLFPEVTIKGKEPYEFAFALCSSAILITWLFGGLYQIKLTLQSKDKSNYALNMCLGVLASVFQFWMIIEAGFTYIMIMSVTYIPAFVLYHKARKADGEAKPISGLTLIWTVLITIGAIVSMVLLAMGQIDI